MLTAEELENFEMKNSKNDNGPDMASDDDDSINEGDSSLSLTKHLPEDIKDDNLDSLVLEAEKIIDGAENVLENKTDSKSFPSSQDNTGAKNENHKYLRAAETIEYEHDELDPEADSEIIDQVQDVNDGYLSDGTSNHDSEQNEDHDSDVDGKEQVEYDEDFDDIDDDEEVFGENQETENYEQEHVLEDDQNVIEDETAEEIRNDATENNGASNNVDDDNVDDDEDISAQCWCDSLRRLDIPIPDEVTSDWLFELSLATIPEEVKPSIPGLIAELQEKIEIEDPQEEFKQLRGVKPTDACSAANLVYNRDKNRFRNVLPCMYIHHLI